MFFKNYAENKAGRLDPDLFLFFKKNLYKLKASGQHLRFNIFWKTSTWTYNEIKLHKIDPNPEIQAIHRKISSHKNKKALSPFDKKIIFFIEIEFKTPYGCLTFIFYQEYFFHDKINL